ncbi:MAG TPA: hypothetical protein VK401_06855 [Propionibacteriaceae bacterium]|jgi:hypothetical protein|nr:hypothetical protein [Propionibacteriaceae bacterium]
MASNRDTILLETVRTHRARLLSAFLYGQLAERRLANDNLKRLIGSIVLAAVVCTGCVGFSLITSILARQAAARAAAENKGPVVPGISDQPYAADYFDRTSRRGWGSDDMGNRWVTTQRVAADFTVRDGAGVVRAPADRARLAYLDLNRENADVTAAVQVDELGSVVSVVGRRVGEDDYRVVVTVAKNRAVSVALVGRQERQTVPLANNVGLLDPYAEPGLRIRMQAYGVRPTVLRAKVWPEGEEEPQAWTIAGQGDYEPLQRGGVIGIGGGRPSGPEPLRLSVIELVARPVFA